MIKKPGRIFVFFGTRGSSRKLLARTVQTRTGAQNLVKYSSRPPRLDDVNGMDNHFLTNAEFDRMESGGVFLDAVVSDEGFRFGVATDDVESILANGQVAFVTAPAPLDRLKRAHPDNVTRIFVHTDRSAFRETLQSAGESRFEITTQLKNFDLRSQYGRTCEHEVLHGEFSQAFSEILTIVSSYWSWPVHSAAKKGSRGYLES